ncbi:Ig-like domain-containing protein [Candidatus Woesearchaeota archaeon]|nr:Ig-like domain-containing protein [Candidatus Woesearchaeota archaeon]
MSEKKGIKKEIVIGLFLLVFAVLSLLSIYVFSDIEIFSASQQNLSMCNVQGYVFSSDLLAVSNGTNISCTIARNNEINTTYTTLTGKGFPEDNNNYNNSYRCTMTCSNVIADTITVLAYNSSGNGTSSSTMSGSTKVINITFTDNTAPIIISITGNKLGYTNQTISIEINATDNVGIIGGNITLGNGTVLNASLVGSNYTVNLTLSSNSLLTINYTAAVYDTANNNATSATYYITVSDNIAPTSVASVNQSSVDQNVNIQFNGSNSSDNIGIVSYLWNFGDSSTNTSEVALHKFTNSGMFNVSLNTTDAAGNSGFAYVTVTIRDSTPPYIISNLPSNGSLNLSLNTDINITFNELVFPNTNNIHVQDSDGNIIYGNISFNTALNKTIITPYVLLKETTFYTINVTKNLFDNSTNNLSANYIFNFTTKLKDTDNDGLPDSEEYDNDNDGINDTIDKIKGNISSINTDILNLVILFNQSSNLTNISDSNASYNLEINSGLTPVLTATIDFSTTTIDLTNITIYESDNQSVDEIIIYGLTLPSGQTKTVYLTNKSGYGSVCIKNAEIQSLTDISQECTSTNEYKVNCNATVQNGFTCTYNSTINKFKVEGLSYSGLREINYTIAQTTPSNSPSSGAGGGGGGGGGGGTPNLEVCVSKWECGEWGECTSAGMKSKDCTDINSCSPSTNKPSTTQFCTPPQLANKEDESETENLNEETNQEQPTEQLIMQETNLESNKKDNEDIKSNSNLFGKVINAITGKAIFVDGKSKANMYFLGLIVFVIICLIAFNFVHKQKSEKKE